MNIDKLYKLAIALEAQEMHDESVKIGRLIREINAAPSKDSDVEISSWPDFLGWWNNNRGQALSYIFIDTYGENSEEAQEVIKLIQESNALEEHLHKFYMQLRQKAQQSAAPGPAAPAAPAADEDLEDLTA
jgi:geranylgeranyl pyrophosphate synthase